MRSTMFEAVERDVLIGTPTGTADAYFVHPARGVHPGVIVWPDAFGLRPAFRAMAKRLAGDGYAVLVPNPYYRTQRAPLGVGPAAVTEPAVRERIMAMAGAITPAMTMQDGATLAAYLDAQDAVDVDRRLGVVGYCIGGAMAIHCASAAPARVGAVASFHGARLVTSEPTSPHRRISATEACALIAIAEDDDAKEPTVKSVLRDAYEHAGLGAEVEVYAGAKHGWCPPDTRTHDEVNAERAWSRLLVLLGRALG